MKKFPFSELISEMHPLLLHHLNLIRLWNDHNGIKYTLTKDTIQIKTQILEPLKSVIPNSFIYDNHITGEFKMSYESDYLIRISEDPETLNYRGNYYIVSQVSPIVMSINQIFANPRKDIHGLWNIAAVDPTIDHPDGLSLCEISPLSETTLSKLTDVSKRLKSNSIKYFRGLETKIKNRRFTPEDYRNKIYQQMELIDIFQQSFMELHDSDLIVLILPVEFSKFHAVHSYVSTIISWIILNVYQSIKIHHIFQAPNEHLSGEDEYVLGWQINFWV